MNNSRASLRVVISNIPWTVSHGELFQHFNQFGRIRHMKIEVCSKTGLNVGHGRIQVGNTQTLDNLLNHRRHEINGERIRLRFIDQQREKLNEDLFVRESREFNRGVVFRAATVTKNYIQTETGDLVHDITGSRPQSE